MGLERVFELFRRQNLGELPTELPGEDGLIYLAATDWVSKNLVDVDLTKQPFSLSPLEIKIIKTSLTEQKATELLSSRKFKTTGDHVESVAKLNVFFENAYEDILRKLIEEHNVEESGQNTEYLNAYIANAKKFSEAFVKSTSSTEKQMQAAYNIKARKPIVLLMRGGITKTDS